MLSSTYFPSFLKKTAVCSRIFQTILIPVSLMSATASNMCPAQAPQSTCGGGGDANQYSIVYVTIDTKENATNLARKLVQGKYAACVNLIPGITSIYEWQSKINEDPEILMMIKTRTARVPDLTQFVKSNHPYEVCEVISVPIQQGNPDYFKWIAGVVPEKP